MLSRLVMPRGAPKTVFVDKGSEFTGRLMDMWAYHHRLRLDFSRPGKPTDNCFVEASNGKFRNVCLNEQWFETLHQAREGVARWRRDYNEVQPHSAIGRIPPAQFAAAHRPEIQ